MSFTIVAGEGGAPAYAAYVQMMGAFAMMSGDDLYKSPYHFTAVAPSASDKIDLTGGFPQIYDETQFGPLLQRSALGVVTVFYPQSDVFVWNPATNQLQVVGATFATTDTFTVVINGADRAKSLPDNAIYALIKNYFQLNGDDAGVPLLAAGAQALDGTWTDIGSPIGFFGYNKLKLWVTVNINLSNGAQLRVKELHESGGVEEYDPTIEAIGTSVILVEPAIWQFNVDADALNTLVYKGDGATPYLQIQGRVLTVGGTPAEIDALYYTRGTFGG